MVAGQLRRGAGPSHNEYLRQLTVDGNNAAKSGLWVVDSKQITAFTAFGTRRPAL
jgi:hypothetical protein